jgi:hypothetical protein
MISPPIWRVAIRRIIEASEWRGLAMNGLACRKEARGVCALQDQ